MRFDLIDRSFELIGKHLIYVAAIVHISGNRPRFIKVTCRAVQEFLQASSAMSGLACQASSNGGTTTFVRGEIREGRAVSDLSAEPALGAGDQDHGSHRKPIHCSDHPVSNFVIGNLLVGWFHGHNLSLKPGSQREP